MLRCVTRYRNHALDVYAEPGDLLRDLSPDLEQQLLRDSPGSWELVEAAALDEPPEHRMMTRRMAATRADRAGDPADEGVMTRAEHAALLRGSG